MKKQQDTLFCVGFGDSARAVAGLVRAEGWRVVVTTRSEDRMASLRDDGVEPVLFDETLADHVPDGAHWLISTPPDEKGCPAFAALGHVAGSAEWIGYLSTTGVYGDLGGGWAFEWTPVNPQSEAGERRVAAETAWRGVSSDTTLFRLPGIYGPGRSALDRVREGKARRLIKKGQVFSRIHVEDIGACVQAALERDIRGTVLHPCDDYPAPPQDVITYAAELLGVELPPAIPVEMARLSPMAMRFYSECKRMSNARTKSMTGWRPIYPDYQTGLRAIHEAE